MKAIRIERFPDRCVADVYTPGVSFATHNRRCSRKGKVVRNGRNYCAQHDPEARKKREEERQAARDAQREARFHAMERVNQLNQLEGDALVILREIVLHGANSDNLGRAHDLIEKYDELSNARKPTP